MIRKIIFFVFLAVILNAREVSVFGAGDVESSSPYGLTKAEKVVYKNTKKINKVLLQINKVELSYEDLIQKLEGMESGYESDSKSLHNTKRNLLSINHSIEENSKNIEKIRKKLDNIETSIDLRIRALGAKIDNFIALQQKNNQIIEETLDTTIKLVNKINTDYVAKKQFDELVVFINKKKSAKRIVKKQKKSPQVEIKNLTNKQIFEKAKKMYANNLLTKSIPLWKRLIKENYKPAISNYYLGKVRFYKKQYKDAIYYFKASMMLYDQAPYIPTLLLNSAISFEKLNDKDNAMNFYSTLVDAYPDTKEAQEAQKKLEKLK
jgi:TolA-binding protein